MPPLCLVSQFQKRIKVLHTCLEAEVHLSFWGYNPISRLITQNQKNVQPANNKKPNKQEKKPHQNKKGSTPNCKHI